MTMNESDFTHVRDRLPSVVEVSAKASNKRTAVTELRVELGAEIIARFEDNDLHGPKGLFYKPLSSPAP